MFKIVAPATGSYEFTSTDSTVDVKGWLYNASGTQLAMNDDGNGNRNFKITHNLTAGQTYYLKVSHFNQNRTGVYTINIDALAPLNTTYTANIDTAGKLLSFKFIPTTSGAYRFYSENNGSSDPYGYLYDADGYQLAYNDDSAGGRNFSISYWLEAGQTYYYKAKLLSATAKGSFDIKLVSDIATTYTVTYNGNSTEATNVPAADKKVFETALILSRSKPIRSGYVFLGWSTSNTATTPTYYNIGTKLRFSSNANTTLYAVWCRKGDLDLDSKVTVSDVITLNNHLSGSEVLTDYRLFIADVNEDGVINSEDVTALRSIIVSGSANAAQMEKLLDSILYGTPLDESVLSDDDFMAKTDWNGDGVVDRNDIEMICGVISSTQQGNPHAEQFLNQYAF